MTRWHRLFRRRKTEADLEKELRFHLDEHTSDLIARGLSLEEARRQALLALGGEGRVKEMVRDVRRARWLTGLLQDIRYGVRMLRTHPGFTTVAVFCLALGIGANTAIFSFVYAAFFRPLPIAEPDRIVYFSRVGGGAISYPDFRVLRESSDVLTDLSAYRDISVAFGNGMRSEVVLGSLVTGNYFDLLGVKPVQGRSFLPEEDRTPGTHPVVILSYNFWQSRFNKDPSVIGRTLVINSHPYSCIGIAPAGFDGLSSPMKINLWVPVMMHRQAMRGGVIPTNDLLNNRQIPFSVIGKLKPDVSVAQARVALEMLNRQNELANPPSPTQSRDPNEDRSLRLRHLQGGISGVLRDMAVTASKMLVATVLTVLLIACANVANLLLARAATRRKEVAVRLALGATRWRLIRQLMTESMLLALAGATAGLLLANWINQLLMALKPPFPSAYTFTLDLSLDLRTFGFALMLALLTGVIFGLVPALQASKPDVVPALKDEGGAESARIRWFNLRSALVVSQVALSLTLLISTGLFLRSLNYARQIDLGFNPENVLEVSFDLGLQGYSEARGREFYRQIVERIERLPGVQTASVTNILPLGFIALGSPVVPEGREVPPNERLSASRFAVGSQYFETIGTPLIRGRNFTANDTINSPQVAIVSEKLARGLWPEIKDPGEALGKRLRMGIQDMVSCEVVGVARDSKNNIFNAIDREPAPTIYRPFTQNYSALASVVTRTSGDPRDLIHLVRREVAALDENLPAQDLQPLAETVGLASWTARTGAAVLSIFGLLGLALAAIGIYGVISYSVARRTREIGIRMALGAEAQDVRKLIIKHGLGLTLIGVMIGLMLAAGVTRVVAHLLFGVTATDPVTYAGVALFLMSVALIACYLPARKATKIDPLVALRHD